MNLASTIQYNNLFRKAVDYLAENQWKAVSYQDMNKKLLHVSSRISSKNFLLFEKKIFDMHLAHVFISCGKNYRGFRVLFYCEDGLYEENISYSSFNLFKVNLRSFIIENAVIQQGVN
jgi:hypothetical protein